MSHFTEVPTVFSSRYQQQLVEALEERFGKGNVEVSDEGVALRGYKGDDRSKLSVDNPDYAPLCEVVVRRKHVGTAANDIGYKVKDGKFVAYVSDYDKGGNFNKKKQEAVAQDYAERVAKKTAKLKGWITKNHSVEQDGTVVLKVFPTMGKK